MPYFIWVGWYYVKMRQPKLIILRGPSGSGKSTVAKKLFKKAKHKICLIEQDYYRFIFKPAGGGSKPNKDTIHKMIKQNTIVALKDGYDVILEGILSVKSYADVLESIFSEHPTENYLFYFDVSFKETVRRHHTKPRKKKEGFGEADMKEWYPAAHRSNHKFERIIPEEYSIEETVRYICEVSKL